MAFMGEIRFWVQALRFQMISCYSQCALCLLLALANTSSQLFLSPCFCSTTVDSNLLEW